MSDDRIPYEAPAENVVSLIRAELRRAQRKANERDELSRSTAKRLSALRDLYDPEGGDAA